MKKKILIVSPHPDDASFSLGGSIMKYEGFDIHVWNIFTVQDYTILKESSHQAKSRILEEEKKAMGKTKAHVHFHGLIEAGNRGYKKLSQMFYWKRNQWSTDEDEKKVFESVYEGFTKLVNKLKPDWIGIPIGCGGHIDHVIARDVVEYWWQSNKGKVSWGLFLYEELPYAINEKWIRESLEECRDSFGTLRGFHIDISKYIDSKADLIREYKSQIKERDVRGICDYAKSIRDNRFCERIWIVVSD